MDDSIVNIDEALSNISDDVSESCFDDIQEIVQKWKLAEFTENKRSFDPRTFTRPKKKVNQTFLPNSFGSTSFDNKQAVNLQIGGLVTSMQRSYIGDVSPPMSFCSPDMTPTDAIGNSLITSSDFTNVNYFMNNFDGLTPNNHVEKAEQRSIEQKFNNNNKQAMTNLETSGTSTESNTNSLDESPNKTVVLNATNLLTNSTFAKVANNETMLIDCNKYIDIDEDIECNTGKVIPILDDTFNINDQQNMCDTSRIILKDTINICDEPESKIYLTFNKHQSTPIRPILLSNCNMADISPIMNSTVKENKNNFDAFLSRDTISSPPKPVKASRTSAVNTTFVQISQPSEEQNHSLTNFEEFEKSVLLIEDDKDFDDILNSFGNSTQKSTEDDLKNSFSSIKKRHSLINMAKQQEALKFNSYADSKKIDSADNLKSIPAHSHERLLRRSRLYDDVLDVEDKNKTIVTESNDVCIEDRFKTVRITKSKPMSNYSGECDSNIVPIKSAAKLSVEPFNNVYDHPKINQDQQRNIETKPNIEPLKDGNAPQRGIVEPNRHFGITNPIRKQIVRPRHISGIAKHDLSTKSNSVDSLSKNRNHESIPTSSSKSPMGEKSKSIHSLITRDNNPKAAMKLETRFNGKLGSEHNINYKDSVFKVPMEIPSKQPALRRSGLVRPSSGYYSSKSLKVDSEPKSLLSRPVNVGATGNSKTMIPQNAIKSGAEKETCEVANHRPRKRSGLPVPKSFLNK